MLYEIKDVRQNLDEPRRRWFFDNDFDLLVWMEDNDEIVGFQLSYYMKGEQYALTWHKESGFAHNRVDDGESRPGKPKKAPILIMDGVFPRDKIARKLKAKSKEIDEEIFKFVYEKLKAC